MKYWVAVLLSVVLLCGCSREQSQISKAMVLRDRLLASEECTFDAQVTADYGDDIYTFDMNCRMDEKGDVYFSVSSPEVIAGIQGVLSAENGAVKFEDKLLAFEALADGQLTPVVAPWVFIHALRGGYISCGNQESQGFYLQIDDTFQAVQLTAEIFLDEAYIPAQCDILWQGRRLLSITIDNFTIL